MAPWSDENGEASRDDNSGQQITVRLEPGRDAVAVYTRMTCAATAKRTATKWLVSTPDHFATCRDVGLSY
jgi:hypothetical protein